MLEIITKFSDNFMSELEKHCDEVTLHPTGNTIGLIRGNDSADSIMLAVHTDTPHFICTKVKNDGTVDLSPIGSLKCRGAAFSDIISDKGVRAILICDGTDEKPKFSAELGAANEHVAVGDRFRIVRQTSHLSGDVISGFALSVTSPAAALLECARLLRNEKPKHDVYFAFTAEGQYDYKLYASAARETGAAKAVCIGAVDVTHSGISLGSGAAVRLCDKSFSSDKPLSDDLISHGASPSVLTEGICAASRVQVNGTPSAQLDLPVKYLDSVCETVSLADVKNLCDVLISLCKN